MTTQKDSTKIEINVPGLPSIWISEDRLCDRCRKFEECLGFMSLNIQEWEALEKIINLTEQPQNIAKEHSVLGLQNCIK